MSINTCSTFITVDLVVRGTCWEDIAIMAHAELYGVAMVDTGDQGLGILMTLTPRILKHLISPWWLEKMQSFSLRFP